jgi:hypothetical protein
MCVSVGDLEKYTKNKIQRFNAQVSGVNLNHFKALSSGGDGGVPFKLILHLHQLIFVSTLK